jgi:hypothetical protein
VEVFNTSTGISTELSAIQCRNCYYNNNSCSAPLPGTESPPAGECFADSVSGRNILPRSVIWFCQGEAEPNAFPQAHSTLPRCQFLTPRIYSRPGNSQDAAASRSLRLRRSSNSALALIASCRCRAWASSSSTSARSSSSSLSDGGSIITSSLSAFLRIGRQGVGWLRDPECAG